MNRSDAMSLTGALLAATTVLVDAVHSGVAARGFTDLRPTHGFVFSRLSAAGATVTEVAEHLGFTRQAASQIIDELVAKGYVERRPHPDDARARLVVLTERGRSCTAAAEAAAVDALRSWEGVLGERRVLGLRDELVEVVAEVAPHGPVRPAF